MNRRRDCGSQERRCCDSIVGMTRAVIRLPDDVATLKAMVIAERAARVEAEAKAQNAEAEARARALLIEQMKFTIAKLRHERFGQSSERGAVLEQLELALADMEEDASEAEADGTDGGLPRRRPRRSRCKASNGRSRRAVRLPEHLPRERIVYPAPRPARAAAAPCASSART